jgi:hypothetical protein
MATQKSIMVSLGRGKNSRSDKTRLPWPFLTDRLPFGNVDWQCVSLHIVKDSHETLRDRHGKAQTVCGFFMRLEACMVAFLPKPMVGGLIHGSWDSQVV